MYLESSSAHPPAVVQRRRERDGGFLVALLHDLTEPQQRLAVMLLKHLGGHGPATVGLVDSHVEQAALALAQTYETADRGIVYEHTAGTAAAQRLAGEMKQIVETARGNEVRLSDHAIAGVLRRMETGARQARSALDGNGGERAYLSLLGRFFQPSADVGSDKAPDTGAAGPSGGSGGLVVPPW